MGKDQRFAYVYFDAPLKPTGRLSLVQTDAEHLCIVRDGRAIEGCTWTLDDLAQAVITYRDLKRRLDSDLAPGERH